MRRAGHLFEKICAFENLHRAYRRARQGKRYRDYALSTDRRLEEALLELRDELRDGRYAPGPYREFRIREPKTRWIAAPSFRDRIVHHALCAVIEPILDRTFIFDTYACRLGKGTHRALDRAQLFARRSEYVLHGDVRQYFPSIDHGVLLGKLGRKIGDETALNLIEAILESSPVSLMSTPRWFPGDDLFTPLTRRRGLPIGSLTSQLVANLDLSDFDHFVKEALRVRGYVRYMDDFLIFGDSKRELAEQRQRVRDLLERDRLELHPKKQEIYPTRCGIPFLGFRILCDRRRLKRENIRRFLRRMRRKAALVEEGRLPKRAYVESLRSWIAHAEHGNTWRLRGALLRGLPVPCAK